jgi:hypothetical protein
MSILAGHHPGWRVAAKGVASSYWDFQRRNPMRLMGMFMAAGLSCTGMSAGESSAVTPIEYGPGRLLANLANHVIVESSGLACSRTNPGVFWTHNDSGGKAELYAFNVNGKDLGSYTLAVPRAIDWEDMCSYTIADQPFLLVGSVGDNAERRESYSLYVVVEPAKIVESAKPKPLELYSHLDFSYEDGAHDCESVGVDPVRREILLVSKERDGTCTVYVLPLPDKKTPPRAVAKKVAEITIPAASAMDLSPDGLRALVLTPRHAYEFTRLTNEDWRQGFARPPRVIKMPARARGESVCYGPDGVTIYLTSEGIPTPLLEVAPVAKPKE